MNVLFHRISQLFFVAHFSAHIFYFDHIDMMYITLSSPNKGFSLHILFVLLVLYTYSMKDCPIIHFERRYDVAACILNTKFDYACDVDSIFKINYTIAFHGLSVKQ